MINIEEKGLVNKVYENIKVNLVVTTEDKLRNTLYVAYHKIKKSQDWIGFLGATITILIALLTTNTHEFWGVPADIWQAVLVVLFIVCSLLTIGFALYRWWGVPSFESVIQKILKNQENN